MLTKIKTILKTLDELKDAPIDRMHIFHYGADILTSVDRIRTIVNKEIKSNEREIEKLGRSMPISAASELNFKGNDILNLTNGVTGPFIAEVIETLRQKVVIGEIKNEFEDLKIEAKNILIEKGIIDGKIEKVQSPVTVNNDLDNVLKQYKTDFEKLVNANLEVLIDEDMTEEEINTTKKQVEKNAKKILLKKNPKYQELESEGLI